MRPIRKSRSVNKWYDHLSEVYPVKDGDNFKRNNHQKRKFFDTPPWSKVELTLFYEAYRKYGKDWEKVAAVLRNRSVEMVESLYSMNRAYLSLPEGTASVVGLVAMMSDHYSNLGRSDNERESNYGTATSRKPQKRVRGKAEPSNSRAPDGKFDAHSLTAVSSNGCLPLIKTKHGGGSRPHAAGKRTPRFPVSYSCENIQGEKFLLSTRQSLKKKADANADDGRDNHLDDQRKIGQRLGVLHETLNRDAGISKSSFLGLRKRSKKVLFSRDEASAIEALQTLADLSLKMPSVEKADETMAEIKEEKDNHLQESGSLEAMPGKSQRGKRRSSGVRVKGYPSMSGYGVASNEIPRSCKVSAIDDNPVPEMGKEACQPKTARKKANMMASKATHVEKMSKIKRSSQNPSSKLLKDAEHASRTHLRREESDPDKSTAQVCQANQISLPTRVMNRRKMHLKKAQKEKALSEQSNTLTGVHDAAFTFKDKLLNCLSNPRLRRWCEYEWYYSAIDYPWFAKREFVEYLYHVGLGHIPKLTRAEWGAIRSSLGKPRRFSQKFLKEEKKKLNQYRDSVRKYYADLQKGSQEGLPTDLARPISVGQRVIAIHPKEREIHDGNVLTVDNSRCRVQFDRPELGVEFIMDIDCMPSNHLVNKPTPFAKHMTSDKFFLNNELRMNEQAKEHKKAFCGDGIEKIDVLPQLSPAYPIASPLDWTKKAVVRELKHMNNAAADNCSLKESEPFKKQYAAVLVAFHAANERVSSLSHLRQQNAFQETLPLLGPRSVANLGDYGCFSNSLAHSACQPHVSGHVNEIIESSRTKARTMVHVAMQTMSSLKGSENTFEKIEEAIDIVNEQLPLDDSFAPFTPNPALTTASNRNDAQIPSELITQCVATLLMIQKCTERQFPPADIAQILQSAVTSLKPCCSQNLPAYAEVQKCIGMIKNQILSLLPA